MPQNHSDGCYVCSTGIYVNPNVPLGLRPVLHGSDLPVPIPPKNVSVRKVIEVKKPKLKKL